MKKQLLLLLQFWFFSFSATSQSWTNFNHSNSGIFTNAVWGIGNDIYNNIWIGLGTGSVQGNGIDKFDGINWTHYDTLNSGLPLNQVLTIKGDTNGNIWLCYFDGAGPVPGLTKFDGTNWVVYDTSYSPLFNSIGDIQVDKQNNLWISCNGGLVKYDGATFTNYFHSGHGLLVVQDSINIWLGYHGGVDHFNPITGIWTHYDSSNSNMPSSNVRSIAVDTTGVLWISFDWYFDTGTGITNGGIASFDGTTFTTIWPFQNPNTYGSSMVVDKSNTVWETTIGEGAYKFDGVTWTHVTGLPAGYFANILVDQQNNIWITDLNSGVWTNSQTVGVAQQTITKEENPFPNPTSNTIIVSLLNSRNVNVLNSHGEIVIEKNFPSNATGRIELDISFLSAGIYFIQSGNEVRKFVKE